MSWHSPYVDRSISPFRGIQRGLKYADELEKAGIEAGTEEWKEAVYKYLGVETDSRCRCGRKLRIFELGGEICYPCVEAAEIASKAGSDSQEARMQRMGVPASYHHCTLNSFRGPVPDDLASWIIRPASTLVLFGASPGTGKTHLGTAALYSLANAGRRCFWASSIVLAKRLSEETFADVKETEVRTVRVEVLLLDDLGREDGVVPRAREMVAAVLDERHQHRRITIITTNMVHYDAQGELVVDKLVNYDARLASRVLAGTLIPREGEDERWK